jgi:carbonic anhydrase/acetyltransferase-like protein (isoleucine patch superfamily)
MPIYALGDLEPTISSDAYVHPDAVIIGDVRIGPESSIWPCAVLRGDGGHIEIGAGTSVQDTSVLHTTLMWPTVVGDNCVLGHGIHLEGCTLEDDVLIGNHAQVLHRAVIRSGSIVAANSVVLQDVEVPSGAMAVGSPAQIKLDRARVDEIKTASAAYRERIKGYRTGLRRLD